MKKMMKTVGFIAALSLGCIGISNAAEKLDMTDAEIDKTLVKLTKDLNKDLPKQVDEVTRSEKVIARPGKNLEYQMVITTLKSKDIDKTKLPEFRKDIQENVFTELERKICKSEEMQSFFVNGVTISYSYFTVDKFKIAESKITANTCNKYN